ncbi:MAG: ABC transporter ATP-binding protein [Chloroflexota bacterium]
MIENKEAILQVKNLSAVFQNNEDGLHVLDQLSFEINEGEFVCLIGPSGSGKSTLLRILAGLLPYPNGDINLNGRKLTGPRSGVGMVFQQANLMDWRTVMENIILPLEIKGLPEAEAILDAQELINLVGLQGFEDALPQELSGGMAQRVAIARALVHHPKLLLLDEPFGALDAITRERMGSELLRIWGARRSTVLMVTHDMSEALFLADRVIVFSERPAKIALDLAVSLARPRDEQIRYTPEFGDLALQLREAITG